LKGLKGSINGGKKALLGGGILKNSPKNTPKAQGGFVKPAGRGAPPLNQGAPINLGAGNPPKGAKVCYIYRAPPLCGGYNLQKTGGAPLFKERAPTLGRGGV